MDHYTQSFYQTYAATSVGSAEQVVPHILDFVSPTSVVDVGCGIGTWLSAFQKNGLTDLLGIDGDYVSRDQLLISPALFTSHDLTKPFSSENFRKFDLAVSLEVGEHLPDASADQFVTMLTNFAPVVLFSAAIPFQIGTNHINEQWPNYWASIFSRKGYVTVDAVRPRVWGNPKVAYYYAQNSFLYVKETVLDKYPRLKQFQVSPDDQALAKVHPLKWLELNNPPPIPLRTLFKSFPGSIKAALNYHFKKAK